MVFYSDDFGDFQPMPERFTADGDNFSPSFVIGDVPGSVDSLILICHDPDATGGKDWTHWLVWDIPADTSALASATLPKSAVEGITSFGEKQYGGPAPATGSGPHRYVFSLFAVDSNLQITDEATRDDVLVLMSGHILAQSSWTGTYERS